MSKRKKKGNKRKDRIIVVVLREPKSDVCKDQDSKETSNNCTYNNFTRRIRLWAIRLVFGYFLIHLANKFEIFSLVLNHWDTLEPASFVFELIFLFVIAITKDLF